MKTDEEIYQEKKDFVKGELLALLQKIDYNIMDTEYHRLCRSPYDLEYVLIKWRNSEDQRVYVTGDSLLALSKDVLRVVK